MFNFNKAFVPLVLELRGKIKHCVVILNKVWAYAAVLPEGEKKKSCLPLSGQSQVLSLVLTSWTPLSLNMTGSQSPWGKAGSFQSRVFCE